MLNSIVQVLSIYGGPGEMANSRDQSFSAAKSKETRKGFWHERTPKILAALS